MTGNEQLLGGFWFLKELLYASIISILFLKTISIIKAKLNKINLLLSILLLVTLAYFLSIAHFKIPTISSKTILATAYFVAGYTFQKIDIRGINYFLMGMGGLIIVFIVSIFFNGSMDIKESGIFLYFAISIIGSIAIIYLSKYIWGGWNASARLYRKKDSVYFNISFSLF